MLKPNKMCLFFILRSFTSLEYNPPMEALVRNGFVRPLISLLSENTEWASLPLDFFFSFVRLCLLSEKWASTESSNAFRDRTRLEAAWSLANIAGAESRSHSPLTMAIVADGALAPLIALLYTATNEELVYQALWAVGNIVADNGHFRNMALDKGLLNAVLPFLQDTTPVSLLRIFGWLVANICRTRDPPPGVDLIETLLPKIVWMVNHEDHLVRNLSGDDAKHFRLIQREQLLRIQEWRQESVFSDFFDRMYWRVTFFCFYFRSILMLYGVWLICLMNLRKLPIFSSGMTLSSNRSPVFPAQLRKTSSSWYFFLGSFSLLLNLLPIILSSLVIECRIPQRIKWNHKSTRLGYSFLQHFYSLSMKFRFWEKFSHSL